MWQLVLIYISAVYYVTLKPKNTMILYGLIVVWRIGLLLGRLFWLGKNKETNCVIELMPKYVTVITTTTSPCLIFMWIHIVMESWNISFLNYSVMVLCIFTISCVIKWFHITRSHSYETIRDRSVAQWMLAINKDSTLYEKIESF